MGVMGSTGSQITSGNWRQKGLWPTLIHSSFSALQLFAASPKDGHHGAHLLTYLPTEIGRTWSHRSLGCDTQPSLSQRELSKSIFPYEHLSEISDHEISALDRTLGEQEAAGTSETLEWLRTKILQTSLKKVGVCEFPVTCKKSP